MTTPPTTPTIQGSAILRSLGWFVIVAAGLRAAQSVVVPICVAALLAMAYLRPLRWLVERRVPRWLAAVLVGLGAALALFLLTVAVERSVADYDAKISTYAERLQGPVSDVLDWLDAGPWEEQVEKALDPTTALGLLRNTLGSLVSLLSNLLVIALITVFILLEAGGLPAKLRSAFGDDMGGLDDVGDKVFDYLFLKTVMSLLTGLLAAGLCVVLGVDFPVFWGLVAFLFNFIPTIGSIIAAVPVILLGVVQDGPGLGVLVATGYLGINLGIGNLLEPRLMGRRFGLSTLVVFVTLMFWAWMWGPIGMLLSVPLTMVAKIVLEHTEDYRFVAVLLGPAPEEERAGG